MKFIKNKMHWYGWVLSWTLKFNRSIGNLSKLQNEEPISGSHELPSFLFSTNVPSFLKIKEQEMKLFYDSSLRRCKSVNGIGGLGPSIKQLYILSYCICCSSYMPLLYRTRYYKDINVHMHIQRYIHQSIMVEPNYYLRTSFSGILS